MCPVPLSFPKVKNNRLVVRWFEAVTCETSMSDDPSNRRKLGANRNCTRSAGGGGGGGFLSLEIVAISKNEST